ncbi:extracellular solute-binding protein [Pseudarthrobacter oxydans]|uniref:extracellular solute-binding protein n=1 Tax=Pseudarthrobacter oxydans TaxID=1671 RepID=UPI0035EC15FB|nr:extracellular solute-binding protein [Pseudarthrobacter oxydans]
MKYLKTLAAISMAGVMLVTGCSAPKAPGAADTPAGEVVLPSEPLTINVVDVAGNLQLSQKIFDNYQKEHPELVKEFTFQKVNAPELVGKLQAQQKAGRLDIDLVLTGSDGMASGLKQDVWYDLLGQQKENLPEPSEIYDENVSKFQELAQGKGLSFVFYPGGPLLEFDPAKVPNPPKTPQELLDWAKANPNKFFYARPANSGIGRAFLMGLPYMLGDKDPKDPVNGWEKTWAYLAELNQYIDYYPTGTAQTMTELAQGNRWMIPTTTGWDINPRAIGQVPAEMEVSAFEDFTWVGDGHFMTAPKGIEGQRLAVVLDFMKYALEPEQQAYTYDSGYLYPGPAVKDVPLSMAPQESQDLIKEFGRPIYDELIKSQPLEIPLEADAMVSAFDLWDRNIGGAKVQQK